VGKPGRPSGRPGKKGKNLPKIEAQDRIQIPEEEVPKRSESETPFPINQDSPQQFSWHHPGRNGDFLRGLGVSGNFGE
jgi:hypothetical protein